MLETLILIPFFDKALLSDPEKAWLLKRAIWETILILTFELRCSKIIGKKFIIFREASDRLSFICKKLLQYPVRICQPFFDNEIQTKKKSSTCYNMLKHLSFRWWACSEYQCMFTECYICRVSSLLIEKDLWHFMTVRWLNKWKCLTNTKTLCTCRNFSAENSHWMVYLERRTKVGEKLSQLLILISN